MVSMAGMQRYMSAGQIADYLEIPINTVNSWIRAGGFPPPDVIIGDCEPSPLHAVDRSPC
jgi:hypothetical protein